MSGGTGSGPLVPTFHGFVQNSMDGLCLFEACLSGKLHHVPRRPHDRERSNLIKSGSIFIYEENASGIKRWTDGVAWSPSRILGNFLIYRELDKPFPPGEKKRAMKRKRDSQLSESFNRRESEVSEPEEVIMPPTPPSPPKIVQETSIDPAAQDNDREMERQLIGSLVDSYGFRPDGLVKKTMSISLNGVSHHLVSYYKVDDVKNRVLDRPQSDARLANITVRPDLYLKQNFRTPIEDTEHYIVDPSNMRAHPGVAYQNPGHYGMRPGSYMQAPQGYAMYPMSTTSAGMYGSAPATAWPSAPQPSIPYGGHSYQPQQQPSYNDYYNRSSSTQQSYQSPMRPQSAHQSYSPASHQSYSSQAYSPAPITYSSSQAPQPSTYSSSQAPQPSTYSSSQAPQPSTYSSSQAPQPSTYTSSQAPQPSTYSSSQAPPPSTIPLPAMNTTSQQHQQQYTTSQSPQVGYGEPQPHRKAPIYYDSHQQ